MKKLVIKILHKRGISHVCVPYFWTVEQYVAAIKDDGGAFVPSAQGAKEVDFVPFRAIDYIEVEEAAPDAI